MINGQQLLSNTHSLDLYPTSVAYLSTLNQLKIQLQTRTHVGSLSSMAYLSMGISEEKISLDRRPFLQGCVE